MPGTDSKHSLFSASTTSKHWREIFLAGVLLTLSISGYVLSPRLSQLLAPQSNVKLPLSNCDLTQGACAVTLPDGAKISLILNPRPIPTLKPLQVTVEINNSISDPIVEIEVDFNGVDMDMGLNRVKLTKTEKDEQGQFTGQTNLPVCITGRMPWQATLVVKRSGATIAAPFHFFTGT